jgi:hypothetical protein
LAVPGTNPIHWTPLDDVLLALWRRDMKEA